MSDRIALVEQVKVGKVLLSEFETNHLVKVLRLRSGDSVKIIDGLGHSAEAMLDLQKTKHGFEAWVSANKMHTHENDAAPIRLVQALLKADAMEWVIEKAVELGVNELVPVVTDHTVVQPKGDDAKFLDRYQRIADQAMKQCERYTRLKIHAPVKLSQWLAREESEPILWAFERADEKTDTLLTLQPSLYKNKSAITCLIGPEGGFSVAEQGILFSKANVTCYSLGKLIMRAETAALSSLALLSAMYNSHSVG